ncbi:hypothetical protein [Polaribacter sp. OB-PA-B3]
MSILIVVPDGVGIRNYLFSDIIPLLLKSKNKVIVYHSLDANALNEVKKLHKIDFEDKKNINYKESIKHKFFRETIAFARLNYNAKLVKNTTILKNWNYNRKGVQKIFYKLVQILGKFCSKKYSRILWLENKYENFSLKFSKNEIDFLKKIEPKTIFCTHQRAIKAIPIVKAANLLGIKTVGVIYSWDNIPKARLAVKTDKYLVWSKYMKEEIKLFYPEISKDRVIVTGTPQFDFYKDKSNILPKHVFFEKYNLDVKKKTICFSGDDLLTSPYDPNYLEDICEAIVKNDHEKEYQIIFRRCPVDTSDRYKNILKKYADRIIPIEPAWSNNSKNWTTLYPYYEDIKILTNICAHSDFVINLGSTMAHDFAFFNKPAAYLNYNTVKDFNWDVDTIYKFQHFKSMPTKQSVYWINSKEEIFSVIKEAINQKYSSGTKWLKTINLDSDNISKNIVNNLIN